MPLLFFGLKLTPSINAPIIICSGPIILIVSSVLLLKEKVSSKLMIGTLISLMGVLVIILRPIIDSGFESAVLGNILLFGATICGVAQAIILKKLMTHNKPLPITFYMFFLGALPLLPFLFLEKDSITLSVFTNIHAVVGIFYAVFLATVLAHFLLVYAIKYVEAAQVAIFTYVDPIATLLVAIPLLNEQITDAYIIGAILVFGGIYVADGHLPYHPFRRLFNNFQFRPLP
jgi:drug/metabolite transporter (DMT)-like permease